VLLLLLLLALLLLLRLLRLLRLRRCWPLLGALPAGSLSAERLGGLFARGCLCVSARRAAPTCECQVGGAIALLAGPRALGAAVRGGGKRAARGPGLLGRRVARLRPARWRGAARGV
jgi:hypothetical protein